MAGHNHPTRDIKPPGQCPACDHHHNRTGRMTLVSEQPYNGTSQTLYRVEYKITRRRPEDDDFEEIGFGSSGGCSRVKAAGEEAAADIEHYNWETEPGHPDPEDIKADEEAAAEAAR